MAGSSLREQLGEALAAIGVLKAGNDEAFAAMEVLRAENEELRAQVEVLRDRVAHLQGEAKRDSTNSSSPPSGDAIGPRKKRAERRAEARQTKRSEGKQPGAPGAHLLRRDPDVVIEHAPVCCGGCGADLADAPVIGEVRRQVIDLPSVTPTVVDHVAYRRRCSCGNETISGFPPEARAPVCWGPEVRALAIYLMDRQHLPLERTAELLADLLGAQVSTGWLCAVQAEAAGKLAPFLVGLKRRLGSEPVVHADETGTQVGVKKHWVHTLTTNLLTLIAVHPGRGVEAIRDIGVLPGYAGTIVHDGYASYEIFDNALHAQCGAHLLRHLGDVAQTGAFATWTAQMIGILLDAKTASETAAHNGQRAVDPTIAAALRGRYHDTLDVAFALLPSGTKPRLRHQGGWNMAQRKAWNLATRMRNNDDQVLRMLDDTRVAFDNNVAERALRMVKLHDKISGCFHSLTGAQSFAAVRSYLQTADKHDENLLGVLRDLFTTGPWLPPTAASP